MEFCRGRPAPTAACSAAPRLRRSHAAAGPLPPLIGGDRRTHSGIGGRIIIIIIIVYDYNNTVYDLSFLEGVHVGRPSRGRDLAPDIEEGRALALHNVSVVV